MRRLTLIPRLALALCLAYPATVHANISATAKPALAACQAIHTLSSAVTRLEPARVNRTSPLTQEEHLALKTRIESVHVSDIFPKAGQSEFVLMKAQITSSVTNMRAVLDTPLARQVRPAPNPALRQNLQTLSRYWQCESYEAGNLRGMETMGEGGSYFQNNSGTRSDALPSSLSKQASQFAKSQKLSDGARVRPLALNPAAILPQSKGPYFVLSGLVALFVLMRLIRRRIKKFEAREARRLLNLHVNVKLDGISHRFDLVDLSRNGAKLKHSQLIQEEEQIYVQLNSNWYLGQIRWRNPLFAGIMFKTPLDIETFSAVTAKA